jgi:hypothetical protein
MQVFEGDLISSSCFRKTHFFGVYERVFFWFGVSKFGLWATRIGLTTRFGVRAKCSKACRNWKKIEMLKRKFDIKRCHDKRLLQIVVWWWYEAWSIVWITTTTTTTETRNQMYVTWGFTIIITIETTIRQQNYVTWMFKLTTTKSIFKTIKSTNRYYLFTQDNINHNNNIMMLPEFSK